MPKVYNKHQAGVPKEAKYCGRGSPHGNPFKIGAMWNGKSMTRDDVCDRFEREILPNLDISSLRGCDLVCFCAPERCHCDAILKKANK